MEVFSLTSLGKHLRHLSLARNKLEKIPLAFLYLKNLIYLNLNENLLTNLDGLNDFNNLQKVRVVLFLGLQWGRILSEIVSSLSNPLVCFVCFTRQRNAVCNNFYNKKSRNLEISRFCIVELDE